MTVVKHNAKKWFSGKQHGLGGGGGGVFNFTVANMHAKRLTCYNSGIVHCG